MHHLEVKIFVTSMLLQELLDETQGETQFKNKTRFHINGLQHQLDKVLSVKFNDDDMSMFITGAMSMLESFIEEHVDESK